MAETLPLGRTTCDWGTGVEVRRLTPRDHLATKINYHPTCGASGRYVMYRRRHSGVYATVYRVEIESGESTVVCERVLDGAAMGPTADGAYLWALRPHTENECELLRYNVDTLEEKSLRLPFGARSFPYLAEVNRHPDYFLAAAGQWYLANIITGEQGFLEYDHPALYGFVPFFIDASRSPERTDGREHIRQWNRTDKEPPYGYLLTLTGEPVPAFPLGPGYTARPHHYAWIGSTRGFMQNVSDLPIVRMLRTGSLVMAWPGDLRPRFAEPSAYFIHISTSVDGKYYVTDEREQRRVFVGSILTGRNRPLVHTNTTFHWKGQFGHPHASLTADNKWLVFNSDRAGAGVYAALVPDGFLEELDALEPHELTKQADLV
jgi:hypothetical protein